MKDQGTPLDLSELNKQGFLDAQQRDKERWLAIRLRYWASPAEQQAAELAKEREAMERD